MSTQLSLFDAPTPTARPFLDEVRAAISRCGGYHCDGAACGEWVETRTWDDVKLCRACRGAS